MTNSLILPVFLAAHKNEEAEIFFVNVVKVKVNIIFLIDTTIASRCQKSFPIRQRVLMRKKEQIPPLACS